MPRMSYIAKFSFVMSSSVNHLEGSYLDASCDRSPHTMTVFPTCSPRCLTLLTITLGLLLAEMQKYEEAGQYLVKAGELMPYNARVFYNLGQIQLYLGKFDSAEKSLARAIEIEPENIDYLYVLADFYFNSQMFEKCKAIAIKMEEIYPGNDGSKQLLNKINGIRN